MSEIRGLYTTKNYCLIQMGKYANRARDRFELNNALAITTTALKDIGWKKISSKHLVVWDD